MVVEAARYVLDSFAMLAFLQGEAGIARVKAILQSAGRGECSVYLSWINLGETLYITEREQGFWRALQALARAQALPIQMVEASPQAVLDAAHIKARYPLSYADAFAVAAALSEKAIILTGDPEFRALEGLAEVEWLPRSEKPDS
jgi:predicted nucleic acid-binding protein